MARKKDQNWSTSRTGTRRQRTWSFGVPGNWKSQGVTTHEETKKLIRSTGSPTTRSEKPYHHKHVVIDYPTGKFALSYESYGGSFREYVGSAGQTSFYGGPRGSFYYPNFNNHRYSATLNDWPVNPDLLSQAEVKAYAALRNKYKSMDLSSYLTPGIWWGERKETASLLADAATGLARLVQGVRSLNYGAVRRAIIDFRVDLTGNKWKRIRRELDIARRKARRQQGEVLVGLTAKETAFTANRVVLTANLGVAPLLKDLDAAYLATLQSARDPTSMVIKATGWEQRHDIGSTVETVASGRCNITRRVNSLVRYKAVFVASPSDSDLARFERAGVLNAPAILGELTGLSFIVNYFYPILDYLKAVSTPAAFVWKDGSWSVKVSHLQDEVWKSSSPIGQLIARGSYRHVEFRRRVYSTFPVPIPPLSFRQQDLTEGQAVNVVTVAIEKVRKALGW